MCHPCCRGLGVPPAVLGRWVGVPPAVLGRWVGGSSCCTGWVGGSSCCTGWVGPPAVLGGWVLRFLIPSGHLLLLYGLFPGEFSSVSWLHRAPSWSSGVSPRTHRCGQWELTTPWALIFRFTLGGGPFDLRFAYCLFSFLRSDPSCFPDHSRDRNRRSDEAGATPYPAA